MIETNAKLQAVKAISELLHEQECSDVCSQTPRNFVKEVTQAIANDAQKLTPVVTVSAKTSNLNHDARKFSFKQEHSKVSSVKILSENVQSSDMKPMLANDRSHNAESLKDPKKSAINSDTKLAGLESTSQKLAGNEESTKGSRSSSIRNGLFQWR